MSTLAEVRRTIRREASPKRAKVNAWYFKTGKGQYGEGDIFIGLTVPQARSIAKQFEGLQFSELTKLLKSKIHEERLIALLILVRRFQQGDQADRKKIVTFYLENTPHINNWDLVDTSAPEILGTYLLKRPRSILKKLARSKNLWERRIAIIATYTFIREHQFADALHIAEILLADPHDLIHKAVGWMLREIGKRNRATLENFLNKQYARLPRTTLRYAIERLPASDRNRYLSGQMDRKH